MKSEFEEEYISDGTLQENGKSDLLTSITMIFFSQLTIELYEKFGVDVTSQETITNMFSTKEKIIAFLYKFKKWL